MSTQLLTKRTPSFFDDFFKPWSNWLDADLKGNSWQVPAVNITDEKDRYLLSLAAPGLKKDDFKIDVEGNMLTVSSEKEESKEENEDRYTRREYNFSSFSRSFSLPQEVLKDKIEARYEEGLLKISLPKKEEKQKLSQQINVK